MKQRAVFAGWWQAGSLVLWHAGLIAGTCASETMYRRFSLRSRGSAARSAVSQGGYTRVGGAQLRNSRRTCSAVQLLLAIDTWATVYKEAWCGG